MLGLKKKKYTCTFFRQLLWWWFWSQAIVSPALQPPWPGPDAPPKADPARSFHAATAPASAASPRLPRQGPAQAAPFPFWRAECPRLAELTPCWHRPRSLHGTFIFRSLTAIKTYLDYFQSDSPLNRCSSGGQALSPPKVKEGKTKRNEKNWTRTKALQTSLQPHQRCAQSGVRGTQGGPAAPARPPWQQGRLALLGPMFTAPPSRSPPELPEAAHGPSATYPQQKAQQLSRLVAGALDGQRPVSPFVPTHSPSSGWVLPPMAPSLTSLLQQWFGF